MMHDKYSLFIGRWQPFHKGHRALIQKVLNEGKKVLVAIRDTKIDGDNPYMIEERKEMIYNSFGDKIKVISIPDINEVCYGRDVGYGIREIRLDEKTEKMSSTKIRNKEKIIIWLTGNSGSGKTTLAYKLRDKLNSIVLDGDEMRDSISTNLSFSKEDREEHNLRVARLAQVLNKQGYNVIISVIAPFEEVRKKVNRVINPIWIYVKKNNDFGKDRPYEPPEKPDVLVNTDIQSVEECIETIVNSVVWQNFKK